jgi:peptidoglycan-associated lipoprotein
MKILSTFIPLLFFLVSACRTTLPVQPITPLPPSSFVTWDKKMLDLGAVPKGEKRSFFFEFTNTSKEEAQIEIVDACECTKVEFPRGIIPPGGKGKLDVVFDSTEKDSSETIGINVVFKNIGPDGSPRLELVEYHFDLVKR